VAKYGKAMSEDKKEEFQDEMGMKFPVITISVSYEDVNEPIHVDLGTIPPFVAVSIFQSILSVMNELTLGPKVTFGGEVLAYPNDYQGYIDIDYFDIEDTDEEDDDEEEEEE